MQTSSKTVENQELAPDFDPTRSATVVQVDCKHLPRALAAARRAASVGVRVLDGETPAATAS